MTHGAKGEENMRLQVPDERALGGGAWLGPDATQAAFPLGGIGTGSISLGGRGQLRDWEIYNRPDKGRSPQYAFASIWAQSGGSRPVAEGAAHDRA